MMRMKSRLAIAVLVLVFQTTVANAGYYARLATFYSDISFATVVGQRFFPGLACGDGYWETGTTSDYRRIEFYGENCALSSVQCDYYSNGQWVSMQCP